MPGELLRLWRPDEPKAYHLEYGFSCILQTDKPSPQRIPVPDHLATNQYYFGAAGESLVRRHPDTARIVTRSGTALPSITCVASSDQGSRALAQQFHRPYPRAQSGRWSSRVKLRVGQIAEVRTGTLGREYDTVSVPDDEGRRPAAAKEVLESRYSAMSYPNP